MPSKKTSDATSGSESSLRKLSLQPFVFILFGLLLVQFYQIMNLQKRVDELTPGAEEGSSLSDIFGGGADESEEDELSTLLFDFVNNLGTYEENKARYEANLTALQAVVQDSYWAEKGLNLSNPDGTFGEENLSYVFKDASTGAALLTLVLQYDGTLAVDVFGTAVDLSDDRAVESTRTEVKTYLDDHLEEVRSTVQEVNAQRSALTGFWASPEMQSLVTQKGLKVIPEVEQQQSYMVVIQNADGAPIAECDVMKKDAELVCSTLEPMDEVQTQALADSQTELLALLTAMDARTALQKTLDSQKAQIEAVLADPAFQAALGNAQLSVGPSVETDTSIQYPILNAAGTSLRVLVLDKTTGEVKVTLPDGKDSQSLSAAVQLLEFSSKKKLWTSPVSSRTMLS